MIFPLLKRKKESSLRCCQVSRTEGRRKRKEHGGPWKPTRRKKEEVGCIFILSRLVRHIERPTGGGEERKKTPIASGRVEKGKKRKKKN